MGNTRRYERFVVEGMDIHAKTVSSVDVQLVNISLGGISVVSPKRLNIGGKYTLRLGGENKDVLLQTEVVWEKLSGSQKLGNGDIVPVYTAGLKFRETMTPSMEKLVEYIEDLEEKGSVDEMRLRGVRFRIKAPERATLDLPSRWTVKKLSLGGMLIEADRCLPIDENVTIELVFPTENEPLEIRGSIASCIALHEKDQEAYDMGVRFTHMSEQDHRRLQTIVSKLKHSE